MILYFLYYYYSNFLLSGSDPIPLRETSKRTMSKGQTVCQKEITFVSDMLSAKKTEVKM